MKKNYFFFQLTLIFLMPLIFYGQSLAIYDISFTSEWNAGDHTSVPVDAHWSKLVGSTHDSNVTFFEIGELATTGIKNVAEFGNNMVFEGEVNDAVNSGFANQWLQESFSSEPDAFATLTEVSVSEDFPLLSLVSMIAPSPDWFIAINSLNLRNVSNDGWKNTFTMEVFAYDAGTDSGVDYDSDNLITDPFVPISMISGSPINSNKIGTLTVTFKSVLGTSDVENMNSIKIFPNPTKDKITISNVANKNINNVQVYSVLGKLVDNQNIKENIESVHLNLDYLDSGIYLLKINTVEGRSKTQKLIIQ
jgi:hypothetical protein